MKKILKIIAVICLVGALLRGLGVLLLSILAWGPGEAGSIGIIGGADGPTMIITTAQVSWAAWLAAVFVLLAAAAGVIWIVKRYKGKHKE